MLRGDADERLRQRRIVCIGVVVFFWLWGWEFGCVGLDGGLRLGWMWVMYGGSDGRLTGCHVYSAKYIMPIR
jgi:hypothetical protein